MIELLSRFNKLPGMPNDIRIEQIPIEDDISSLSAIVLDDEYYEFTISHSIVENDIRHADIQALIALKTYAYLNLKKERAEGKQVNTKDIKKHRNDVLKCALAMTDSEVLVPRKIKDRIEEFVKSIIEDWVEIKTSLSEALHQEPEVVNALLRSLDNIFVEQ